MRVREIQNVIFFTEWLNKEYNLDFQIDESYKEEDSPVDVLLKSLKTGERLKIQNKAYRKGNVYREAVCDNPNIKPLLFVLGTSREGNREESVIECIESKQSKYPEEIVKDIILIIEITIPSITPEELKEILENNKNKTFGFKGIYFVKLPVAIPSDEYDKKGFVFPFKLHF